MLLASLIILLPVASASSVGAKDVEVTNQFVKATAMCSCGLNGYDHYITASFVNYCPHCNSYGTLKFNPKGTPEGEWTCSKCNSDYCAASGKEKISGSKYFLKPYNETTNVTKTSTPQNATKKNNETLTESIQKALLEQIAVFNGKNLLLIFD